MNIEKHNDPFGEELRTFLDKYYYLDDSVELSMITIDTRPQKQTNYAPFQSRDIGVCQKVMSDLLYRM